jgi:hypothetical protein
MDNNIILKQKKLSEQHIDLKEKLKNSLLMGQLSFLNAGKILTEIKTSKTYLSERIDLTGTWTDFIKDTELPIPGDTLSSKIRIAQILMNVYSFFIGSKKLEYAKETYAQIGYSKLNLIINPIKTNEKLADEWIEKARLLSFKDLKMEIQNAGMSLEEEAECEHNNVKKVTFWKCEDCGQIFHDDPNSSASDD